MNSTSLSDALLEKATSGYFQEKLISGRVVEWWLTMTMTQVQILNKRVCFNAEMCVYSAVLKHIYLC